MNRRTARTLARILVSGDWTRDAACAALYAAVGSKRSKWPRSVVDQVFADSELGLSRPSISRLQKFIESDRQIRTIVARSARQLAKLVRENRIADEPRMRPTSEVVTQWNLPSITTRNELSELLQVDEEYLDRLADITGREYRAEPEWLRNYQYQLKWKRSKHGFRLLESPKAKLKYVQRRIVSELLALVPTHHAAHGFVRGRSPVTAATPHSHAAVVMRIDLREFFPSVHAARIGGLFRMLGYPDRVVSSLTGLCTNTTWEGVLERSPGIEKQGVLDSRHFQRYFIPHLPQGAPTSPALANLSAWGMDCRLTGLARQFGARYTRYADDLIFSGDCRFSRRLGTFRLLALAIIHNEGFEIRKRKTRVMQASEQQTVAGLVVNCGPGIPRKDYDQLKAILTNCVRHGVRNQNREGHRNFSAFLRGKIAYVHSCSPEKARRLQRIFDAIEWDDC